MSLTKEEKEYLKKIVRHEIDSLGKSQRSLFVDMPLTFLKGGHEYMHFLENLLKKLDK